MLVLVIMCTFLYLLSNTDCIVTQRCQFDNNEGAIWGGVEGFFLGCQWNIDVMKEQFEEVLKDFFECQWNINVTSSFID